MFIFFFKSSVLSLCEFYYGLCHIKNVSKKSLLVIKLLHVAIKRSLFNVYTLCTDSIIRKHIYKVIRDEHLGAQMSAKTQNAHMDIIPGSLNQIRAKM